MVEEYGPLVKLTCTREHKTDQMLADLCQTCKIES